MTPLKLRWALVTGAGEGGMGEAEVLAFLKRGINVIATSIDTEEVKYRKPELGSQDGFLLTLRMDVTSQESVDAAAKQVQQLTDGKLHYLINNAGYGYYMPLLDADIDKAKQQYDVNVWGILRVTQAFFPMLRAAKGVVINQSSISGLENFNRPFMGIYSSSKAAVLSLSATMRVELSPFDIDVVTLVTSAVKTEFFNSMIGGRVPGSSVYHVVRDGINEMMGSSLSTQNGHDRYAVADATIQRLLEDPIPVFIRKGYLATFLSWLYWLLPASLLDSWTIKDSPLVQLKQVLANEVADKKSE